MRTFVALLSLVLLASFGSRASAQEVTRFPEDTRHAVGLEGGLEAAFVARATYSYRVGSGFDPEARLFARFTLPVVAPDLGDWGIDGGAQIAPVRWRDLRVALLAGPVTRKTDNRLFSALAIGASATLLAGYEGSRWGLSLEAGYEQMVATYLSQSDLYKDTFYAGAKDGWYAMTGSVAHAGVRGGARVGAFEIDARVGRDATGQLHTLTPPFYGTIGTSVRF